MVVSSYSFPNNMFLSSYEVVELIRRLHMSCNAKNKMYGPRRPLLDEQYPQLCPFIDQIPKKILTIELTAYHFFSSLNMSEYDLGQFKKSYTFSLLLAVFIFLFSSFLRIIKGRNIATV